jgi:multidrug efflux system membrane fusion protein
MNQLVPVVAVPAVTGNINVYLTGIGSVVPLQTVTVKPQVDGQLKQVLFREGQSVSKGSLIAIIDPRPFEAMVMQAEGQQGRDSALLENARIDLKRYEALSAQDAIPEQTLATQKALVLQYQGSLKLDEGNLDNARLQLGYSRITSPINGVAGLRMVDPGNIVHATDANGIVILTQEQPITVVFTISEDDLPRLLAQMDKGDKPTVEALDRSDNKKLAEGKVLAINNRVDSTTGTVQVKAIFKNEHHELAPGQFVNAHLLLEVKKDATVIPQAALQRGPQGMFVYVVKPDRSVAVQPVTIGPTEGDQVDALKGVEPGDTLVVEGADRLHEGAKVEVRSARPAPGNQSAASGEQTGPASANGMTSPTNPAGHSGHHGHHRDTSGT